MHDQKECLRHYENKLNKQIEKRKNQVKDDYQVAIVDTTVKVDDLKFNNGKGRDVKEVVRSVARSLFRPQSAIPAFRGPKMSAE